MIGLRPGDMGTQILFYVTHMYTPTLTLIGVDISIYSIVLLLIFDLLQVLPSM